jgi:hypothetical protein
MIDLLRNQAVLMKAGAQTVPLGPTGRAIYPRQAAASTAAYVGEGATIAQTDIKTGSLVLSAKRCATLVKMSNDLIRYSSPAGEALVRADLAKTLALTIDKYGLEGTGGEAGTPLGIHQHAGHRNRHADDRCGGRQHDERGGLLLLPERGSREQRRVQGVHHAPADVLQPAENPLRRHHRVGRKGTVPLEPDAWDGDTNFTMQVLAGFPAFRSNQVSITRVKGSGVDLTCAWAVTSPRS